MRWIDQTRRGSEFEQQCSEDGRRWRHRSMITGDLGKRMSDLFGIGMNNDEDWRPGRAPDEMNGAKA